MKRIRYFFPISCALCVLLLCAAACPRALAETVVFIPEDENDEITLFPGWEDGPFVTDFALPAQLRVIGEEAFLYAPFTAVMLPEGAERIDEKAFACCDKLEKIYIPRSVVFIAPDAFSGSPNVVIYCESGSYAEAFAVKNSISYTARSASPSPSPSPTPTPTPTLRRYVVNFHANGGSDAPGFQIKTENTPLILSDTTPTRLGYTFSGWAVTPDATVPDYAPGSLYTDDVGVILYAVWQPLAALSGTFNATGKTQTLTLGQTDWTVDATVSVSGGTERLTSVSVTVPELEAQGSSLPSSGDGCFSLDLSPYLLSQIETKYWAAFRVDTAHAPWNTPGTYTLLLWAASADGAFAELDQMTLIIADGGQTPPETDWEKMHSGITQYFAGSGKLGLALGVAEALAPGYDPAFIAGVLANIANEGNVGQFEYSASIRAGQIGVERLQWLREHYDYSNDYTGYGGRQIQEGMSLSRVRHMSEQMTSWLLQYHPGYDALYGLGFAQWTSYDRNLRLIDFYLAEAGGGDTVTEAQAQQAEIKMLKYELDGEYHALYTSWLANGYSAQPDAAYCAGVMFCQQYEKPGGSHYAAVGAPMLDEYAIDQARGSQAQAIYDLCR